MSKTTTYIVSNNTELENRNSEYKYTPGSSTFEIPFSDIDDGILKIENPSAANGAVVTQVSSNNAKKKIIVTPGASVKTSGKSYNTVIKYNITYNQTDDKGNNITKVAYSKVIFAVSMLGDVSQCIMTAHNGKLRPDEYIGVHPENNDLESLVTKKSLISNLKEFGNQVSSKIGSASALSINYNLNGGHWDEGFEPRYTFVNSTGYTAKAPKRLGYVFAGWNVYPASGTEGTEPAEADKLYSANATGAVIEVGTTQNITAYAQWTPIKYKVVFNNKDGEATVNQIFTYDSDATASDITKPAAAAGYEFTNSYKIIGLSDQEVIYDVTKKLDRVYDLVKTDNETGTPTFTLTPIFAPKVYTINYDIDDGVLETNNTSDTYTYGTSFVLPTPTRSGYSFNGWTATNTSNNFVQQRVISPSDLRNISASTLELKAVWTKNNYHFEFDTQGGILKDNTTIYIQPGTTYSITNPSKEGYAFNGWTVDNNKATISNGGSTVYKITTKDNIDTDIVVKAKWTPVQVNVNVEYWYESISTNRNPDTPADLSNTIYTLNTIRPLTLGSNQKAVTDSSLTIETNTNNDIIITGKTGTNNGSQTITPETGFSYVGYSISDNGKVNANGTSVIKLYFSRKTAYYKVNDRYSDAINSGTEEAALADHYRNNNNIYSCLYGQSITVHPIFTESNPERGYTVNNTAITKTVDTLTTSSPVIFTFEYSKKVFTVKFDLNNVGTYSDSTIKGNIYSITCKYGNTLNLPKITEFPYIKNSSWYLNGNKVNDTDDTITIVEDSNVIRAFELKQYNLVREKDGGNWSYNGTKVTNNVTEHITYNDFPYYLKPATKDGYVFSHWLYKTNKDNAYIPLGGNTLSGNILDSSVTSINYKPEFVAEEPKISSVSVNNNQSGTNLLSLNIVTNSVTSHIYFKATKQNGTSVDGLGKSITKASDNTYLITNIMVPNLTEGSEILITPVYVNAGTNTIANTGKPWYGIIQKVSNKLTVAAYPVYGVIGNDTDTTYNDVGTSGASGLMSATDKAKLDAIQEQANKTSATSTSANFTTKLNSDTTLVDDSEVVVKETAYSIGSITPGTGNAKVEFKGHDTTYGKASGSRYGLVKLGDNEVLGPIHDGSKVYPVRATSGGNLGVYVPWTDNQTLPETKLAVAGTNNATSNAAVSSGPVYINTYDVKGGSSNNTGAISIAGKNGISVTADNGGKIEISGHEKPPVLNTDNTKNSSDGNLVPKPNSTSTSLYLRADGNWYAPTDTQVTFTGKLKNNSYGTINTSNSLISGGADDTQVVKSLVAGTSITLEHNKNTGALTIIGPASGRAAKAGTGLTEDDSKSTTERYLNLKTATTDELGGVKVGTLGTGDTSATVGTTSQTIYAPPASGKYYPIETVASGNHSGHAVVKIPDVPSPFYDNTDKAIYVDSSSLRELKMFFKQPVRAESVDGVIKWFAKEGEDGSYIFSETEPVSPTPNNVGDENYVYENTGVENCIFPIIHFPSTVIFAELQATSSEGGTLSARLGEHNENLTIDTSDIGCAVFPGFDGSSIKAGNPAYAYLRFTTKTKRSYDQAIEKGHTYNATIIIDYDDEDEQYLSDIIF